MDDLSHLVKQAGERFQRQAELRLCKVYVQKLQWFATEIRTEAFLPHQIQLLLAGALRTGQTDDLCDLCVSDETI